MSQRAQTTQAISTKINSVAPVGGIAAPDAPELERDALMSSQKMIMRRESIPWVRD
jgi:hypothetical protein